MYRTPASLPRPELVVRVRPAEAATNAFFRATLLALAGGVVGLAIVFESAFGAIAFPASVAGAMLLYRGWRRERVFSLLIDRGDVAVRGERLSTSRMPLARLDAVDVDEDAEGACIVLVSKEPATRVVVTTGDLNAEQCRESAARIEHFLREHGWNRG